jgi:hypothetical protein
MLFSFAMLPLTWKCIFYTEAHCRSSENVENMKRIVECILKQMRMDAYTRLFNPVQTEFKSRPTMHEHSENNE